MPSEQLIAYRDTGGGNFFVGQAQVTGSSGPGGGGAVVFSRGWDSTLKRHARRAQVTGFGIFNFQIFEGATPARDPAAFYPVMPPNNMLYRIRAGIAAEYVSGPNVSRVGFGVFKQWSNLLLGAPAAPLDLGFIGFLWYQVGAASVNWRAVAADHLGVNRFDVDTGVIAPGIPYNLRVDFDGRLGQRTIKYFIDEVEVASYTPLTGELGGVNTGAMRVGVGVNAANGNVCAGNYEMLGGVGWELLVQEGAP